jgi:hypothetical protein
MKKRSLAFVLMASIAIGFIGFNVFPFKEKINIDGAIANKDLTELIGESNVILRGTVKEILPSKWTNPDGLKGTDFRNILQTDIVFSIDEIYKGTPSNSSTLTIRIDQGETKKVKVVSEGYPDFKIGESSVLFVSKDDSDVANINEDYYVLTGMGQGDFKLKDKTKPDKFSNNKEVIDLLTFKDSIPVQLEKYKNHPKMADPKKYQP